MLSKIAGIPLSLFVLVFVLLAPVLVGEYMLFQQNAQTARTLEKLNLDLFGLPMVAEVEPVVTPTATPSPTPFLRRLPSVVPETPAASVVEGV